MSPIVADPTEAGAFCRDTLGLPLEAVASDYIAVDGFEGTRHFGVRPLADAAQSRFGAAQWPTDIPVPQATIEFEVADVQASATSNSWPPVTPCCTMPTPNPGVRSLPVCSVLRGCSSVSATPPGLHQAETSDRQR